MGISIAQTNTASKILATAPTDTLADFTFALQAGSRCFCCGSILLPTMRSDEGVVLGCLECGAEVAVVQDLPLRWAA
ncbi:MAG: hypothetical protein JW990_03410 [Thermoleophilia bacterium]|nr:hypothetical protein [Thermoleophilia bacterium]